jgi:predicted nucleotidyltransferase
MREKEITETVCNFYPDIEAIYLFGSYGTGYERADSDLDIALLLPADIGKRDKLLALSPCTRKLEDIMGRTVDLINLRQVSTVFQHEIIKNGKLIYNRNAYESDTFEMITMSLYQKLNDERSEILKEFIKTRRAYNV